MDILKGFKRTDFSIMFLMFLHAVCAILTGTTLAGIIISYGLSDAQAGSIETIRSLSIAVVLVITVRLLKIFSAKTLFIISRLGIAVGFVVSAMADNYMFFLFGVVLAGLGAGFLESLIAQTITNIHKGEQNIDKYFNCIHSFFSIAVIIVPLVYGYAMQQGIHWQTLFMVSSALPIAVAIVLYLSNLPDVEPEEGGYKEAIKKVFGFRAGRLFTYGIIIAGGLEAMFYLWSATYIKNYLNDNQQIATTGLAIFGLAMFISRLTTGLLPGKKSAYHVLMITGVTGIISSCLLFFLTGLEAFYIALAFAGLTVGPLWPSITGLISDHAPDAKAGYFIIIAIMGQVGYASAPLITGIISDVTGNLKSGFILLPLAIGVLVYTVYGLRSLAIKNGTYNQ